MNDGTNDLASAERARWLAELAEAIEDAQRLAWRLGLEEQAGDDARQLYAELELARAEVEALRRGGWTRREVELPPNWLQSLIESQAEKDRGG